jgi:HPt (histidine-containing phosphotransfer) domain-containing protein
VDRAGLAAMLGDDDPAGLAGLLQIFADEFRPLLDSTGAALRAQDRPALKRTAHACKGAARSAAARPLATILEQLEGGALELPFATLADVLAAAELEYERVLAEIGKQA